MVLTFEDIEHNKNSREVIGFMNMGDASNQLSELEQACKSDKPQHSKVTKQMPFAVSLHPLPYHWYFLKFPLLDCLGGHQTTEVLWLQSHCDGYLQTNKFYGMQKVLNRSAQPT